MSKYLIRLQVWRDLSQKRLLVFPFPFGRIPDFKGCQVAANKLLELPEFMSAKSIEVNPDKTLELVRMLVLKSDKQLFVPVPQLRNSFLKLLEKSEDYEIRKIAGRWGIDNLGKKVGINEDIHIDLVVVGSVAVSRDGYRIGKGKGFADLEFALLKEMGAINDNTTIVTVVHDNQVFDELPKNIFQKYDVPVDYILTPTAIIKTHSNLPKPEGIYWDMISQKRLNGMDILRKLKEKYEAEGRDVILKPTESNSGYRRKGYYGFRGVNHKLVSKKTDQDATVIETDDTVQQDSTTTEDEDLVYPYTKWVEVERNENIENIPPYGKKRKKKTRKPINGYSLCVSNIHKSVRVRDLKNALIEKGIRPKSITWQPFGGFCYLHYSKKNGEQEGETRDPCPIDNVIELIQEIKINPKSDQSLTVKVMEPITRIETLDVTAV